MRFELDLSQIQVVAREDRKGNPVICLDLFGNYQLYKEWDRDNYASPEDEAEALNDFVPHVVGSIIADLLLTRAYFAENWTKQSPTGREVSYLDRTIREAD